ncbi:MAG: hypothetical protein C5B51_08115 [Terriglobia bacterium]|nr:MAG: hypothetical protein C5B51_08115 [Terriglobia bacterium]
MSAQRWHTLGTAPSLVRIHIPPLDRPEELRLDLAERRTSLWLYRVSLLDRSGGYFWSRKGTRIFEEANFAGLHVFPSGDRALVIVGDKDCALRLSLDDHLRAELAHGAVMELEMCGMDTGACIDTLAARTRLEPPEGTVTRVFWRVAKEDYCESRSVQKWHVLRRACSDVRIELPSMAGAEVLRLDLASGRANVWVHQVSLLDSLGRCFWSRNGNKFFEGATFEGLIVLPSAGRALVIVSDGGGALELPLDEALSAGLAQGGAIELKLQGIKVDRCIDALAARARLSTSQLKILRSKLRETELPLRNGTSDAGADSDEDLSLDTQRLIAEREDEIYRLRAALALAARQKLE